MSTKTHGTALITGASTGIGAIYADRLAKRGYDLILVARNQKRLAALARTIAADAGRAVETVAADLTTSDGLGRVEQILRSNKRITMLINNAGFGAAASLADSDIEKMDEMIRLNVTALTRLTHAVVPGLVARGGGTIVNIASAVAIAPEKLNAVYGATKGYGLTFTLALNHELAGKNIRVQAVLPGATATEFWDVAGRPVHQLPSGIVMSAEDMVDAALAGLDLGEVVTIPALPDPAHWDRYETARQAMSDKLSSAVPAPRYTARRDRRVSA
jgi:uncharacterized protein